jgi:hypothetical protein
MRITPGAMSKEALGDPPPGWLCSCGIVYCPEYWIPIRKGDGWYWATVKCSASCGRHHWQGQQLSNSEVEAHRAAERAELAELEISAKERRRLGYIIEDAAKRMRVMKQAAAPVAPIEEDIDDDPFA